MQDNVVDEGHHHHRKRRWLRGLNPTASLASWISSIIVTLKEDDPIYSIRFNTPSRSLSESFLIVWRIPPDVYILK
jgi:hypothetical protein